MAAYIYALFCPDTGRIRYIGKADNPDVRLRAHITRARTTDEAHHSCNWIRGLLVQGKEPVLRVIEVVDDGSDWRERERFHIEQARIKGHDLTNITPGGEGVVLSDSGRRRLSEKSKARWADGDYAERARQSLRSALREKHQNDPDYHQRCAEGARAAWARKKQSARYVIDEIRDWITTQPGRVVFSEDVRAAFPTVLQTIVARHLASLCDQGFIANVSLGVFAKEVDDPRTIGVEVCARYGFDFTADDFDVVAEHSKIRLRNAHAAPMTRSIKVADGWLAVKPQAYARLRSLSLQLVSSRPECRAKRREIALRTWADPMIRARRVDGLRNARQA